MKAILIPEFLSSLNEVVVSELPNPVIDEGKTLLIKVTHVSPTHVDMLYVKGKHQNNQRHAKPPFVLGMDFAGTVEHAPSRSEWQRGDNVYGSHFGAFQEYIAIDSSHGAAGVRRVPKQWSNAEACAVGASGAISLGSFYRAQKIRKDEWVLVTGASGGLGVMAIQVAKELGAKVIALVGSEEKAKIAAHIGADACVSYNNDAWEKEVLRISEGGVSVVYDAVGMVEKSLRCCRFGGTVVIVGFAGRGGQMETMKLNRILLKGAGVVGYRFGEHSRRSPSEVKQIWLDFDRMIDSGLMRGVVYKRQYKGLQDVREALLDLEARRVWGRAVVQLDDEASKL